MSEKSTIHAEIIAILNDVLCSTPCLTCDCRIYNGEIRKTYMASCLISVVYDLLLHKKQDELGIILRCIRDTKDVSILVIDYATEIFIKGSNGSNHFSFNCYDTQIEKIENELDIKCEVSIFLPNERIVVVTKDSETPIEIPEGMRLSVNEIEQITRIAKIVKQF